MTLKINEIFSTIQGEGSWTGRSATFVRFSKCNLSCIWCDTEFEKFTLMKINEIITHIKSFPARHIVITGGEPTLQYEGLLELTGKLHDNDYFVALETNGTKKIDINCFDHVTVSPKEAVEMVNENQIRNRTMVMTECHNLKIIEEQQIVEDLAVWEARIKAKSGYYLQPLSNDKKSIVRCVKIVQNSPIWRLSLQTHKVIGLP